MVAVRQPAKVLLIDDEASNRMLLEVLVKADGHVALAATTGEAGLGLAVAEQPDIILLDLMMPGMDGFEVMRRLKDDPRTASIPVIVVTALHDIASRQRMLSWGVDDVVLKPVDRWDLSGRVSKLLRKGAG